MALIRDNVQSEFNLDEIGKGWVLYGKHVTWDKGKAGIVTSVTPTKLTVQFYPDIANVTNHFFIPASEVADGQWQIRWSKDLSEVFEYEQPSDEELTEPDGQDIQEGQQGTEGQQDAGEQEQQDTERQDTGEQQGAEAQADS